MSGLDFQVIIPSHPAKPRYVTYNSLLPYLGKERLLHVLGYPCAYARNLGIAKATAEIVVQTDDDAEIPPDYIRYPVSLVKPKRFVMMEIEDPLILAGYRRDFVALGGFDERIRPYLAEDTEFQWRAISMGYELLRIPKDERIRHLGGLREPWSRKELLAQWNLVLGWLRYKAPTFVERRGKPLSLRSKLFRYFFMQWYPPGWRVIVPLVAFPYWMVRGKIGKRNSFGW